MKIFMKYILFVVGSLFLASCSLSLGGLVALDNSFAAGSKEIDLNKLSKLKKGTKVIFELADSTTISGTFEAYEEIINNKTKEVKVTVLSNEERLQIINSAEVNNCTIIDEGSNIWTAIAIGATIDAILIYFGSKSKGSLGNARIF